MADQTISPPLALSARRILKARPARVFQAWTEPAEVRQWFAVAPGYSTPLAEIDLRLGGRYRFGMQPPGNPQVLVVTGEYQEIAPAQRLSFTWRWEAAAPDDPVTLVTVLFQAHPQGTELVLTHTRFNTTASRDEHALGWEGCLVQLEQALAGSALNT